MSEWALYSSPRTTGRPKVGIWMILREESVFNGVPFLSQGCVVWLVTGKDNGIGGGVDSVVGSDDNSADGSVDISGDSSVDNSGDASVDNSGDASVGNSVDASFDNSVVDGVDVAPVLQFAEYLCPVNDKIYFSHGQRR